jgi:hypothetical protein
MNPGRETFPYRNSVMFLTVIAIVVSVVSAFGR